MSLGKNDRDDDIEILDAPEDIEDINSDCVDLLDDDRQMDFRQDKEHKAFHVGYTYQRITIKKTMVRSMIDVAITSEDHQVRNLVMLLGTIASGAIVKPRSNRYFFIDEITTDDIVFFVAHPILREFAARLKESETNSAVSWLGAKLLRIAENIVVRPFTKET